MNNQQKLANLPEGNYTIICRSKNGTIVQSGTTAKASKAAVDARVLAPNRSYWTVTAQHGETHEITTFEVNR